MSSIGSPPPATTTQIVPTHSPLGKPAVGLESAEDKQALLPPIEDATETEHLRHRDVVVKLSEEGERHQREHRDDPDDEPGTDAESAPVQVDASAPGTHPARHPHGFYETGQTAPGLLLDQEI